MPPMERATTQFYYTPRGGTDTPPPLRSGIVRTVQRAQSARRGAQSSVTEVAILWHSSELGPGCATNAARR